MISKPLFKQSCKANAGTWTFVTVITCAMLAIIILVLGNLNVSSIRDSMVDMFVEDSIESTVEKQSVTYFDMTETALNNYDENREALADLFSSLGDQKDTIIDGYDGLISSGKSDQEARAFLAVDKDENTANAINTLINYYNVIQEKNYTQEKINEYVLRSIERSIYNSLVETEGTETANNAKTFINSSINAYLASGSDNTTEFATLYIPQVLKGIITAQSFEYNGETLYISDYYTEQEINDLSLSSILSFRAEVDIKTSQLEEEISLSHPDISDEDQEALLNQKVLEFRANYIANCSGSLMEKLPAEVTDALMELGSLDIFSMMIGSIFYRIAGLLLPIIYIIMVSNNLIASQVDSGSMAYVLSTPTKRRTVTVTQMTFMILSLLAMFALTTITGVVSLAIVGTEGLSITYTDLLLFNLGAFITSFAISGICFLASSWFNRSRQAMSVGGGLSMFFLVATILGLFGSQIMPSAIRVEAMNYFNYVSVITLFDTASIMNGTLTYLWKFAILLAIGLVTYFVAIKKFDKKDLPL